MVVRRRVVMSLLAVLLPGLGNSFQPFRSVDRRSTTHRDITVEAILRKTAEVCRDIAAAAGEDFSLNIDGPLTEKMVQSACLADPHTTSPISTKAFQNAINTIYSRNARVDFFNPLSAQFHFDNEAFQEGRILITKGLSSVKANVQLDNFEAARETLGEICHTLQDFYSHSNWVELERNTPYSALIKADQPLVNLAGADVATCRNCIGDNCSANILPEVLNRGLITSGYFDIASPQKPAGKCSHGGSIDQTSGRDPVGGINKDALSSSHGSLHRAAARLAVDATMELLEDIRLAVGDRDFLRLMGLTQSSTLCFVIDTTGSMGDDIEAAKQVSFDIIDSRRGTLEEPSLYILVPFNDPGFGPATRTTDPDAFKETINSILPLGGGDNPELSLSGLQLALTAAPPSSEMFLFTDAPAKDAQLKGSVLALIESTKSVVTFMLTDVLDFRRRRRQSDAQSRTSRTLNQGDLLLYQDIAQSCGGQVIDVSKSSISEATAVIRDSSASAVVTVFQAAISSGGPDIFTFIIDASISNTIIYVTGDSSLTFNLTSPSGVSQMSTETSGPLAAIIAVGNLRRISLNGTNETGLWEVIVPSELPYTVRVTGQSSVDFVYDRVEEQAGIFGDVDFSDGRPPAGGNLTLLITVTGSDTATVTNVTLSDDTLPREINGTVESIGDGNYLGRFQEVPGGRFVVRVIGEDTSSASGAATSRFQRQAPTQIRTSSFSVTARANSSNIEPGSTAIISFTVSSSEDGNFAVQVNNDRGYAVTSPASVTTAAGEANGTVSLTVPASAASGTDVTLTIEVQNTSASDLNFAVLKFSVASRVTDLSGPVCRIVNVSGICPASSSLCASSLWEFTANLTDGINGTGIQRITIRQGNGTLNTSTESGAGGENVTVVTYNTSCCVQMVTLAAVDQVGNVGTCEVRARMLTTPAPTTTFNATTSSSSSISTTTSSITNTTSSCRRITVDTGIIVCIAVVLSLIWT